MPPAPPRHRPPAAPTTFIGPLLLFQAVLAGAVVLMLAAWLLGRSPSRSEQDVAG